jgi:hypothetical protein
MLVFRENRVSISAQLLLQTLAEKLRTIESGPDALLDALLSAGELECALADAGDRSAMRIASITDALADAVVHGGAFESARVLESLASLTAVPRVLKISPPEGFAYYALHPLKYSDLAARIPLGAARAAVIGIRSIGTTLSAVVMAGLKRRRVPAERITVRPQGHPFHRATHFTDEQVSWVEGNCDAAFVVVDEGPGLSGSSLLSVGEALIRAGVSRERIRFICSHYPNPDALRTKDGAARWSSFTACAVDQDSYLPPERLLDVSGGGWRRQVFSGESAWPSSWPQIERVKFLSADGKRMFKFEGYGKFGQAVWERNRAIARAGFGLEVSDFSGGFVIYPWLKGERGAAGRVSEPVLERLADYCAFRAEEFRGCALTQVSLAEMVRCNLREEFGIEAEVDGSQLEAAVPTIVDGRMHPHEWVHSGNGEWLKVDGGSHGDDHFYPGPADIVWDLAGTIVEWELDRAARKYFLDRYRARTGDDPASRLPAYLLAYLAFRLGYCKMAAESVGDANEVERLTRDYERYRSLLEAMLAETSFKLQVSTAQR